VTFVEWIRVAQVRLLRLVFVKIITKLGFREAVDLLFHFPVCEDVATSFLHCAFRFHFVVKSKVNVDLSGA
jgi:hypothetical protein